MYYEDMLHYNYHAAAYSHTVTGFKRLGLLFQNLSSRPVQATFYAYD